MAPELLLPTKFGLEKGGPSKEADIYALGMTMYQVLTGEPPFRPKRKAAIIRAVISGERPAKPENAEEIGITEVVWDLLRGCWGEDRTTRPNIDKVFKAFSKITHESENKTRGLSRYVATLTIAMAAPHHLTPPRSFTTYQLVHYLGMGMASPAEIPDVLMKIFNASDYKSSLRHLPDPDLMMWVELLDQVPRRPKSLQYSYSSRVFQIIGSGVCKEHLRRRTLRFLRKTCGLRRILPKSHFFRGRLLKASNRPVRDGTADVWKVTDDREGVFAAKVFRANQGEDRKIKVGSSR